MLIDDTGQNLGEIRTDEALKLAYEKGLDLVEINPNNKPPICKIMDFGKYKYELAKKEKLQRERSREIELKEIRLTFKIGAHDIEYKAKQARGFFDQGDKVKVSMRLRGRENAFAENAYEVFRKFGDQSGLEYEKTPVRMGNQIIGMVSGLKKKDEEK